jgi:glycosyltransferase involved in cell wall biosynthesis
VRIALLHPTYWPEVWRGSERIVHDAAASLAARGHEVALLTSHDGPTASAEEDGFRVVRARRPPRFLTDRRHYELHIGNVPRLVWELLRGGYDVAHAFFPVDAWAALEARRLGGPPVVWSFMGIVTRGYLVARRYRLPILLAAAERCQAVAVLSEAAAAPFRRYLGRDPVVLPPGVLRSEFEVDAPRSPAPTLLSAASANDARKRTELLLAAFERLRARRPDARLRLTAKADPFQPQAEFAAIPGVEWIDPDSTQSLARAYAEAWVSALPAYGEAFGLGVLEALACGTPGVAAGDGGVPELLDRPQIGLTFAGEPDADSLARTVLEALELAADPHTARACRARAEEFSLARCVDAHLALYRELLAPA